VSAKTTGLSGNALTCDQFEGGDRNKDYRSLMKYCLLWPSLSADLLRFSILTLRAKRSLAAENLFLRKQLAFYQ
jgi:hypothetical protein